MKSILITGITGFVGVNLVEYLKDSYHLDGIFRNNSTNISYDNLNVEHFNKANSFIHLAGKAHDIKGVSKPEEYFEVNTELTKRLFDIFLQSECEKFIFISSVKASADTVEGLLLESDDENPITPYGQSKLEAERYIQNQKIPNGKKVYILRPCMIHGPNNKGNLNLLYNFISKGIPYPLGSFKNKRSFVSIDNFCFVIKELVDNNIESGLYNVADEESVSTTELVRFIGQEINKPAQVWNMPKYLIMMLSKIGDLFKLPLNSHRLDKLTENYQVSNKKLVDALGEKLPISAKDGLKKTIKSFK